MNFSNHHYHWLVNHWWCCYNSQFLLGSLLHFDFLLVRPKGKRNYLKYKAIKLQRICMIRVLLLITLEGPQIIDKFHSLGSILDHEIENLYASSPKSFVIFMSSYTAIEENINNGNYPCISHIVNLNQNLSFDVLLHA